MQERLKNISVTQSITMLLVVMGHSFPLDRNLPDTPGFLNYIYYLFSPLRMPYFFLLSGFLFYYTYQKRNIEYITFIKKKINRLIIPYIVVSTLAFFPKAYMSSLSDRQISFSFKYYCEGIVYPHNNPILVFWFLPTLFLMFLAAPIIKSILNKNLVYLNIVFLLFLIVVEYIFPRNILILNISGTIQYLKYFYLGCLFCKYSLYINKYLFSKGIYSILYFILLFPYPLLLEMSPYHIYYFAFSIIGIFFMYSMGNNKTIQQSKWLNYYAKYTYQVYLLHWFFGVAVRVFFQYGFINYYYSYLFMFIGGVILPIFVAIIIRNHFPKLKIIIGM